MSGDKRAERVMRVVRMYILDANEETRRLKAKIERLERAEGGESDGEQDWNGEGGVGGAKGVGDTGESEDVSAKTSEDGSATENRAMDKFRDIEDDDDDVEIMGNDQAAVDDIDDNSDEFEIMNNSEYFQDSHCDINVKKFQLANLLILQKTTKRRALSALDAS
ncbi:hypothetical protein B0O99DRAFT_682288 [Bisporella sp. PMI_857]|nr:hypothetical protein B0O99DRAFT_682701 [Bisporella sp. PMI_857]KAH8600598.1 hypothetical protein B0O99DRAFT_682288 [Bisporella sp. PMI_857]